MDKATRLGIGRLVRTARVSRGITQADLGTAAGVTVAQISNIECGRTPPSLDTLIKIGRKLRVPVADLLSGTERVAGDGRDDLLRSKIAAATRAMSSQDLELALDLLTAFRKRLNGRTPHRRP